MRINVLPPPPSYIYIYTPYSYDIFLYSRKCAAPPASSFRFSSMAAHEKQIKVDLPLLTSLLARPSLYIYLFGIILLPFYFWTPVIVVQLQTLTGEPLGA